MVAPARQPDSRVECFTYQGFANPPRWCSALQMTTSARSSPLHEMLPTHSTRKPRTTPATVIVFIVLLLGLLAFCGYALRQSQSTTEDLQQQLVSLQKIHEGLGANSGRKLE